MGSQRQLRAEDGFTLGAYEALPDSDPKGSLVVIQEIFGVNGHIREVVDRFAQEGFAATAPQIFDRAQRGVELGYGPDDMAAGFKLAFEDTQRDRTLVDLQAAVEEIGKHGKVGVVGFCYGGLLTWLSACNLSGVAAAVCYYGGGIADEVSATAKCPVMMHFGEKDSFIPPEQVDTIKSALTDASIFVYPADHGFNCDHRDSYHAESARIAWERTIGFFDNYLGD